MSFGVGGPGFGTTPFGAQPPVGGSGLSVLLTGVAASGAIGLLSTGDQNVVLTPCTAVVATGTVAPHLTGFTPFTSDFPPEGPVTLLKIIPSYLYQQYADDDNLQAFVAAYNEFAQAYQDWFVNISLPVYTNPQIQGPLLDWVAAGLYGMTRPSLPSGIGVTEGPYNTVPYNTLVYNDYQALGPPDYFLTTDDTFKRILTWHIWKGDGKLFDVRWLKRRVMRFLTGTNGGPGETDETYVVSVTFGDDNQVNINLQSVRRFPFGGAIYGADVFNSFPYNQFNSTTVTLPTSPYTPIFKAAMDAGVLEVPFQFTFVVNT